MIEWIDIHAVPRQTPLWVRHYPDLWLHLTRPWDVLRWLRLLHLLRTAREAQSGASALILDHYTRRTRT